MSRNNGLTNQQTKQRSAVTLTTNVAMVFPGGAVVICQKGNLHHKRQAHTKVVLKYHTSYNCKILTRVANFGFAWCVEKWFVIKFKCALANVRIYCFFWFFARLVLRAVFQLPSKATLSIFPAISPREANLK